MLAGAFPSICRASSPTATILLSSVTATTDGSLSTMPRPRTYTRRLAVPRSIPICLASLALHSRDGSLVPPPARHAQAEERLLEIRRRCRLHARSQVLFQRLLGPSPRFLCTRSVDLL